MSFHTNSGKPAPPLEADELQSILEKPKHLEKQKHDSAKGWIGLLFVIVAISAIAVTVMIANPTESVLSESAVITGDVLAPERIQPPSTMPAPVTYRGTLSGTWQPATLATLAWHTWTVEVSFGETVSFYVSPRTEGFVPIIGIYDASGVLLVQALDRTQAEKQITHPFVLGGTYTVLVSSIGGLAGQYDIRMQPVSATN
jgi:hypothetical protein